MRHLTRAWVLLACAGFAGPAVAQDVAIQGPEVFLRNVPFTVTLSAAGATQPVSASVTLGDGTPVADTVIDVGEAVVLPGVVIASAAQTPVTVRSGAGTTTLDGPTYPGWISLLPPLIAILLAFIFREVVTSLFAGIWLGCMFLAGFNPISAIFLAANRFALGQLTDSGNASIVIFSLMLGGMVGVVTRMGGMRAIVDAVAPLATTRKRGQVATWLAGLAVFFDDYSNTLIVGNTMRPLTDRLKVSREKLAYIVDSTAAPVAALFFVSTWIGYEVGLIGDGLQAAARQQAANPALVAELTSASPFGIFIETIPYLFYPLLAIFTVVVLAISGRDFGPMLTAERRAASGNGLHREGAQLAANMGSDLQEAESVPDGRWWNGALPVLVLLVTVLTGLVTTGLDALGADEERTLRNIFGGADPFAPLVWGSILAGTAAIALAVGQRILSVSQSIDAWISGLRAMLLAVVILVLAWSLGGVTETLEAASFLAGTLSEALAPWLLPFLVFIIAAIMAFATGTSWATMAILLPLVVPLAIVMIGDLDPAAAGERAVVLGSIGSVLAGAIFGDHCSPISDTTVLSSMASSCDHVDHVRTQLPYAVVAAVAALLLGSIPSALGVPVWLCLILSVGAIMAVVRFLGRPVVQPADG